jgi:hypothetical protein
MILINTPTLSCLAHPNRSERADITGQLARRIAQNIAALDEPSDPECEVK